MDPEFQAKMLEMLKQTGRYAPPFAAPLSPFFAVSIIDHVHHVLYYSIFSNLFVLRPESVVGWYHSHPGFGCWLSSVDMNTQQSFEQLNQRSVAVVIDPIQSVKGKVVIDAFRLINTNLTVMGQEPRQTTSNVGHLNKPSIQALIHGLNRHYYSLAINYRKNELEQKMLANLHKKKWTEGLTIPQYDEHAKDNETFVKELLDLAKGYHKSLQEEEEVPAEKLVVQKVGKLDPKKHLEQNVQKLLSSNIIQTLGTMLDTVIF